MALALVCAGAPAFADDEFVRAGEALAAGDTTSALAGFDRVARAGGELAEAAHFEQVRLMADQGGAQTVEEAREFLGRYPDSVYTDTVRGFLADALIAANRGADAFAVIDTRLTDRPEDSPDIWTLRRARALASAGRIHEALADAYLVTHEGFKSPVVADARKLADELRAKGASARTPTPGEMAALFDRYFNDGWFQTAGWIADRVQAMAPGSDTAQILQMRAVGCVMYRGRWKQATSALASAKKSNPTSEIARALATIYDTRVGAAAKDDFDMRRALLLGAARTAPGTYVEAEALWASGNIALNEDRFRIAAQDFERAYQVAKSGWIARESLWFGGFAAHLSGDDKNARRLLETLYRFDPDHADADRALYWWGRSAEGAKMPDEAERVYLDLADGYPRTYYGLAAEARLEAMGHGDFRARRWLDNRFLAEAWGSWLGLPTLPENEEQSGGGGDAADAGALAALAGASRTASKSTRGAFAAMRAFAEADLRDSLKRHADLVRPLSEKDASLPYPLSIAYSLCAEQLDSIRMADLAARHIRAGALVDPHELVARRQFPMLHSDVIERNAREKNLDPFLMLALVKQESAFQTHAQSWAAARGLMQVIPSTGRYIAKQRGIKGSVDLYDIETNVDFGTWYFARAYHGTGGDVPRTLAGYNAGPGRATRWWGENAGRRYDEVIERIPFDETRHYVKVILRNWEMYQRLYQDRDALVARDHVFEILARPVSGTDIAFRDD
ncbi:MAG: lytic transglycosylase domain-containing protein [Deltaproteobacteria bacterium]|nr:lytic transglycosylase domain-containing protein [Deltaproteobacteria bacterium]